MIATVLAGTVGPAFDSCFMAAAIFFGTFIFGALAACCLARLDSLHVYDLRSVLLLHCVAVGHIG